jgi:hypothetical protein
MSIYGNAWNPNNQILPGMSFNDLYYNQNPDYGYQSFLNQNVGNQWSPYGQFAQQQQGRLYNLYGEMAPRKGIGYQWTDYLKEYGQGELERSFRGLSPRRRGESPGVYGGRIRWIGF